MSQLNPLFELFLIAQSFHEKNCKKCRKNVWGSRKVLKNDALPATLIGACFMANCFGTFRVTDRHTDEIRCNFHQIQLFKPEKDKE